ncbi:class V chitinase [Corynascus novoguineensis]|uniref:chitinase n=1 Tax=Corynascus novoguineensis TaxID=1126955 RepID=A0AAN7D5C8_9PEZI|nr:class V chitinase [Corynascus novoguineensis]
MGQTCSYIFVEPGDSCGALASRCGISDADFTKYNPGSNFCSTLMPKQPVCCSEGDLPDLKPKPNADGTCASYTVQPGEYCALIAENHYISVADIESYNAQTWGWAGCNSLARYANICLSPGDPPMPSPVDNAICGPQVPGTARPADWSQIATLNPCPLNACCNIWGQCGITPEFCTPSKSSTAAPGTNGCISHCGTDVVSSSNPPAEFLKVGYFEAFNVDQRPCLNMQADQIPQDSGFTHVHYAFAGIAPGNFTVDVSANEDQFQLFAQGTASFKRILSLGGWSDPGVENSATAAFREAVSTAENRAAFAQNIADFLEQHGLDGIDLDWEYPSTRQEGANYLAFVRQVRRSFAQSSPTDGRIKTISVAVPASYYYLQHFPVGAIAEAADYLVFMAYDLHGAWDYGSETSQDGCGPLGDCLRSHVNTTETGYELAMVTKARAPSAKVVVGLASYGRAFKMAQPTCRRGPTCRYLGEEQASPGRCTRSPGIIAQAEIDELIAAKPAGLYSWYDAASDSDMVQYDTDSWAAYLSESTKESRRARYRELNLGGSADWAIDLAAFVPGDGNDD